VPCQRRGQRREVLALAVAAEDDDELGRRPVGAEAVERGDGRADVRALAVVEGVDAVDRGDMLDPVRLAAVLAQGVQHRRERAADGVGQGQRGERVEGVVPAADAQRVGRHELLQGEVARRGVVVAGPHQPGHVVADGQAPVARPLRRAGAELDDVARHDPRRPALLRRHGLGRRHELHRRCVVAVDDDDRASAEDPRLRGRVGRHRAVPVEMVLGEVEQRGRVGLEPGDAVELEARELEHPDLRQAITQHLGRAGVDRVGEGLQHRRPDVAGDRDPLAAALDQQGGQRRRRRLAVGAGDRDHLGRVVGRGAQALERVGEDVELALDRHACLGRGGEQGGDAGVVRREARALQHPVDAGEAVAAQRRGWQANRRRDVRREACGFRRLGARVPDAHLVALAGAPARHRQAGGAESENEGDAHRSFRLARPIRQSSMVTIQKRTTTCVSCQPDFSK
jgi:hypothetical protein